MAEYTLQEFISERKDIDITSTKLHYKEANSLTDGSVMVLPIESILNKYHKEMEDFVTTKTLTTQEARLYSYNPQLLSFDLYGTTELWFLLLDVNNLYSISQFTLNPVKVYDIGIINLINSILNLEQDDIDRNEDEITKITN